MATSSDSNSDLRIMVAGAGLFGTEHIRLLAATPGVSLVGIADAREDAVRQAAARFGVGETATDAIALIDRLRPDGVIVATPGPTHVALASHALGLGIPVLVEKPVAMTHADASKLAEAATASSAFVLPGHVLRFSGPHRQCAEIARSGQIGKVLSVTARRHRDEDHARRYSEDPVLMTMIHDIDLALWMTGERPTEVTATRRPVGLSRSETLATATLPGGAVWRLATAWTFAVDACPPDRIEIVGEKGGVELEAGGPLRIYGDAASDTVATGTDEDALRTEHGHFIDCIRSGRPPTAVTIDDAVAGLAVAEAVLNSIANEKAVPV